MKVREAILMSQVARMLVNAGDDPSGRWVTTEDGNKLFIGGDGELRAKPGGEPIGKSREEKGESSGKVGPKFTVKYNGSIDEIEDVLEEFDMTEEELVRATGAQDGASIGISVDKSRKTGQNMITVKVDHPDYWAVRIIAPDHIKNDSFFINEGSQGKGLGTKIFKEQVDAAAKMGFKYIATNAGGEPGEDMNGYYTWPRLGYDADLKDVDGGYLTKEAQKVVPEASKISDLMRTQEGREWWKANGTEFRAQFDLSEGSQSRKVLDEYVKAKARKG
jgi:GNAT superfamily N-acetyltransferase